MKISLAGWSAKGLRCPDIDIDLSGRTGAPAKVVLIQMPNGTGKTTTLTLLRAALTGSASKWTPTEVRQLRRPLETNDKGQFRVTLLIDSRPLTFEMLIDFDAGSVSYRTTRPSSGGVVPGFEPPLALLQFLTPSFLDLFIFDGEFADELLKQGGGRADAAIGALCHLDLLNEVRRTAEVEWKRRTSQGGPKSAAGLTKLNDERDELIKHKARLEKAREKARNKLETGTNEADDLRKKINEKLSSVEATKSQHAASQLALQTANAEVSKASGAVMTLLRMPLALHPHFSRVLVELRDNLDNLKLPENTSAQFFAELVKEEECICGRTMNSAAQEEILKRAKSYLDYEESGTINALKHDISRFVVPTEEASRHEQLEQALNSLGAAKRLQRTEQQTLSALTQKLIDAGDAELQAWQTALNTLEVELARCTEALESINAPNEEESGGPILSLKLVEKKLRHVGSKIAELTETVELKKKTDALTGILVSAESLARASIRADLLRASNERLEHVLADDPIRIDRIDQSLHLANQTDASAGQKLSVGYTFLMSALSRGNNDFPLIVDSPANPIDEGVRRRIGKLIPTLCTQFVGFTINTERAGFVQTLERSSDDCLLLTLFRRTEGTRRLEQNLPSTGVIQTETATLVKDRDYFMSFDVTDEKDL